MDRITKKITKFMSTHLWWMAPVVIIMPLVYFSGNAMATSAAYFGTTGIWNVIEKVLDQV